MAIAQRWLITMCYEASTHWKLSVIVLLGFVMGIVSSYPIPSRTNDALLERRWEAMFSRSILGISGENSKLNWENDYLLGIKRVRRLYCNVGIGFHLQVLPDGRINGIHTENQYMQSCYNNWSVDLHYNESLYSLIEISTVERGVVSLYGVKSELFVAMNTKGRLYGTVVFHEECKFREILLPNNYNAYESSAYRGSYIALSKHGRVKRGSKASPSMTVTHFLPRI
ncbi:FGF6 factor, partial [Polyodon spathula]|nr:FGF6 factor [Polyodon spathula]